ncbi:inositol monophosphatase [Candidatus Woesearchaeota archaeon]|jgi:myo-inositol-1(or 4)-monophosphatase|nr:inositol monophosphatase [Candidatus Woesearchaeota archaeon]MBT4368745.1 inositol monophosphatase [Candidatus Woesearchaeota archaeon]MBT4712034.1 inositol monophosphatase [Candidatus Woesearchaeota archaeon]MBT6639218.1 inositol monophosphatase [Candidatus Woesearchaeota archaeon]MBT7134418.1 inositol monophosphatase [Candidatus Woesearchaeota archaeon]
MRSKELKIAIKAARAAGRITSKYFKKELTISHKEKKEIVTNVDKESEKKIIHIIQKSFPSHSIWSEERPELKQKSDYRWVIDPVDGTLNYAHKLPFYSISIGLEYKKKPVVAVIYVPALNLLFHAEKGKGAFLNNKPIHVTKTSQDLLYFVSTNVFCNVALMKLLRTDLINRALHIRSLGSAALEFGLVASGKANAAFEYGIKPGDIAAGILLVKEAGGKVVNINGKPATSRDKNIIATNSLSHLKQFKVIKKK